MKALTRLLFICELYSGNLKNTDDFLLFLEICISVAVEKKDEYSQEIPEYHQWEKVRGPPVLPPHLLQVILNKDTPISVSLIGY